MSDLKRLTQLCELLAAQEAAVEKAKEDLAEAKKKFDRTRMEDIPELMQEVGVTRLTLEDGSVVDLREEVDASITKAKAPAAIMWLHDHGYGGIIKTKVIAEFTKDEREDALEVARRLKQEHIRVDLNEAVHPSTLKSFVKERLREGDDLPMDLFSIHPYNVAKIKRSK